MRTIRKTIAIAMAGALLLGFAGSALAGKKKIHDSFTAQAAPLPNYSSITATEQRSCLAGVDGVHKVSHPFKAPSAGKLTAKVEGFTGDWDLFLTDTDGKEIVGSAEDQIQGGAEASEVVYLTMKAGQSLNITPCNWLGQPSVDVTFDFVPSK